MHETTGRQNVRRLRQYRTLHGLRVHSERNRASLLILPAQIPMTFPRSSWDGDDYFGLLYKGHVGSSKLFAFMRYGWSAVEQMTASEAIHMLSDSREIAAATRVKKARAPSAAMQLGSLLDEALLDEPFRYEGAKGPDDETRAYVAWVADRVRREEELAPYLTEGPTVAHQVSVRWQEASGLWCRARLDIAAVCHWEGFGNVPTYVDLKWYSQVDPARPYTIAEKMKRFGVYEQKAHYRRGYAAEWGAPGEPLPTSEQLREPGFTWAGQDLYCPTMIVTQPDKSDFGCPYVLSWLEPPDPDRMLEADAEVAEALENMAKEMGL